MKRKYGNLFQDWEVGLAMDMIDKFKKRYFCLKKEGYEDLVTWWIMMRC